MSPPADDSGDGDGDADTDTNGDQDAEADAGGRPVEFDPPTAPAAGGNGSAGAGAGGADRAGDAPATAPETTTESLRRTLDDLLPEADADSRWWYWIAAVPVYFLVTLVGGAVAAAAFVFAGLLDLAGFGGLATLSNVVFFGGLAALLGLIGLVVAALFPVALYVDARAVESLDCEWTPDPVLWGLLAVAGVLVTNFVVSVPLALYYLYRRHEALGVP